MFRFLQFSREDYSSNKFSSNLDDPISQICRDCEELGLEDSPTAEELQEDVDYAEPGSLAMQDIEEEESQISSEPKDIVETLASAQALPMPNPNDGPGTQPSPSGNLQTAETLIHIEDLRLSLDFIHRLKEATVANDFVSDEVRMQLSNPPQGLLDFSKHPDTLLAIKIFLTVPSRDPYKAICADIRSWSKSKKVKLSSFYYVKKIIQKLTRVTSVVTYICVNSCHTFIGEFAKLENCDTYGEL